MVVKDSQSSIGFQTIRALKFQPFMFDSNMMIEMFFVFKKGIALWTTKLTQALGRGIFGCRWSRSGGGWII